MAHEIKLSMVAVGKALMY